MINEITCNSNNAIEMSRGQLLQWLNSLLRSNYSKIEQMGTGVAYCQILDILYPCKVPLSKVNCKAKFQYEYLSNFKVLQQSFTKLNIMKHIDVEKLVKCKYQDNLQFLQWFKKIYDASGGAKLCTTTADVHHQSRRADSTRGGERSRQDPTTENKEKQNMEQGKKGHDGQGGHDGRKGQDKGLSQFDAAGLHSPRSKIREKIALSTEKLRSEQKFLMEGLSPQGKHSSFLELRKILEIEHLMESWQGEQSGALINQMRKIISAREHPEWKVEDGQFMQVEDGLSVQMEDGQLAQMEEGQLAQMEEGQLAQMEEGQFMQVEDGLSVQMEEGQLAQMEEEHRYRSP